MIKLHLLFGFRLVRHRVLTLLVLASCGVMPAMFKTQMATVWANSHDISKAGEHSAISPPGPTEFITAWISDLKQSSERWIQVDLSEQRLTAWEGDTPMFSAIVSTGREGDRTPPGVYAVETKYEKTQMQGDGYNIPDVPYVMYFFGSYAIHGVYWHSNFGTPVSRGCVGLDLSHNWLRVLSKS